jgi:site-specific DNA-methyltransferase (adenine-specific)
LRLGVIDSWVQLFTTINCAMQENKQRAGRNRTLTVSSNEVSSLESFIRTIEDLKERYEDDSIVNGDLFECIDFVPNKYFDLIIVDPPYNLDKDFNGKKFSAMNSQDYENYLRSWFQKVCDKLKDNGSLYMCGDWKCTSSMQRVIEERLTILNRISWQREKGRGAKNNWKNGMEDIWFAVKNPKDYYFDVESVKLKRKVIAPYKVDGKPKDWEQTEKGNFRLTYPSNFWDDISIPFWSMPENTDHPTQKPEKLYAKLILASSKSGGKVFDPFLGSGTAAVVALKLGRHFFGIEINHEYCLWSVKRLVNSLNDLSIQGYSDGVFWERNTLGEQKKAHIASTSKKSLELNFYDNE